MELPRHASTKLYNPVSPMRATTISSRNSIILPCLRECVRAYVRACVRACVRHVT